MTAIPTFNRIIRGAANKELVIPALRAALWSPDFKSVRIEVKGFEDRPPDGWFHPSAHPLWTEPMLYIYLTNYERMVREPFDPQSTLAVTAGSFFHTLVQTLLVREGILEKQSAHCPCGHRHPERAEVYLVDEDAKSRGHSDGVVAATGDGWEFKTMNPMKLSGIPNGVPSDPAVLDWFKTTCRSYYGQAQEYLRMSGRERMVVTILQLTYPFEMREIHVPFDRQWALGVRDKFKRVIQAVADQQMPRCECGPAGVDCPAFGMCWYD